MPAKLPGPRHYRNGLSWVALCGARDGVMLFAWGPVTCEACRAKRLLPAHVARSERERVAKRRAFQRFAGGQVTG